MLPIFVIVELVRPAAIHDISTNRRDSPSLRHGARSSAPYSPPLLSLPGELLRAWHKSACEQTLQGLGQGFPGPPDARPPLTYLGHAHSLLSQGPRVFSGHRPIANKYSPSTRSIVRYRPGVLCCVRPRPELFYVPAEAGHVVLCIGE